MADSNDAKKTVPRRLWVVMFDTLVLPDPDPACAVQAADDNLAISFNSFDDLEVRSTCFEQYVVQNVKSAASESERLGGVDCVASFIQGLLNSGHGLMSVELHPSAADATSQPDTSADSSAADSITSLAQGLGIEATHIGIDPSRELPEQLSHDVVANATRTSLVWFLVRNQQASQSAEFRERTLSQILNWHESLTAERPMLMVTALCGEARELMAPLESAIDEGLIRIPLWVDTGRQHARRVQSLAGSFDILPTIADLLDCPSQHSALQESANVTRPYSLMPLCGIPSGTANDTATGSDIATTLPAMASLREQIERRVLRLAGDGWTGLRAQQYQLIHGDVVDADLQDYQPDDTRRLFLKPDDMWNVSDAIVTYEIIADEMESQTS